MKTKNNDLLEGKILPTLIRYSIPIILSGLIQVFFNAADMAVLGAFDKTPDSSAVGAIGATGAIIGLLVNSMIGFSTGTNVLLARVVGAKDDERAQKIIGSSLVLSVMAGVTMLAVGIVSAPWFLDITSCPENSYSGAIIYMNIYFAACPAILVYNFASAIIRVSGDSRSPFIYILISGVANVVLNVILCFIMEEKVAAVAIATLVSNVVGATLAVIHLARIKEGPCRINIKKLQFSWREMGNIILLGFPAAFTSALYSISNVQIQGAINSFGSSATAGNSASAQVESFIGTIVNAIATSAMVFVGQNVGASKRDRVKQSIRWCLVMAVVVAVVLGYGALAVGRPLLRIFVPNDSLAVEIGRVRLACLLSIYFVMATDSVLSATIKSFGYPTFPMMNSMVTVILFRTIWMNFIYPNMTFVGDPVKDVFNVFVCYMFSWTMSLLVQTVLFAVIYGRYKKGIVKKV